MEQISLKIGERLKEIRKNRNLTLDEAAALTEVSKPMLGQIERGQSSPTINTLWKISTGLRIPLSFFYRQEKKEFVVAQTEEETLLAGEDGGMRAYPLFPFDPARNVEIFYIEFDPGVRHDSKPHVEGVEEYVFVVRGTLQMEVEGARILLQEKKAMRFQADSPHVYENISDGLCCVYNMIFYPAV